MERPSLSFRFKLNDSTCLGSDTKTVILHLIRHAKGEHNEVGEVDYEAYKREDLEDAVLSSTGLLQCLEIKGHNEVQSKLANDVQLLVVSPLRRTLGIIKYIDGLLFKTMLLN